MFSLSLSPLRCFAPPRVSHVKMCPPARKLRPDFPGGPAAPRIFPAASRHYRDTSGLNFLRGYQGSLVMVLHLRGRALLARRRHLHTKKVAQAPGPGPGPRAQARMEGVAPSVSQRGMYNSEESAGKGGDTMTTRIKGSGGKGRGKGVKGRERSGGGR